MRLIESRVKVVSRSIAGALAIGSLALLTACAGQAGSTADTAAPTEELLGTYWKLSTLDGERVPVAEDQREAHMVLDEQGRITGSTGCNRVVGSYELDGDALTFSQLASTRMACPKEVAELERDWMAALSQTAKIEQRGDRLILENADERPLAELEANALY